jgi:hypothetical protein
LHNLLFIFYRSLHGCSLGYEGASLLVQGLLLHPSIVSLDLGDCHLTDSALMGICDLLPANGAKPGLPKNSSDKLLDKIILFQVYKI